MSISDMKYHTDQRGPELSDHREHADIANLPKPVQAGAQKFAAEVLHKVPPPSPDHSAFMGGCSPKMVYSVPGGQDENGMERPKTRYMVKPYYENFDGWDGVYYPLAGFSEMATQDIFHAAGMGDQAQKIHTFEHEGNPYLAVELDPNVMRVSDYNGKGLDIPDHVMDNITKMGVIDYLTNHQDRHHGNLMFSLEGPHATDDYGHPTVRDILAIDNGRSFGYRQGQRHSPYYDHFDHLFSHLTAPGVDTLLRHTQGPFARGAPYLDTVAEPSRLNRTAEWWKKSRNSIVEALRKNLSVITHPEVKAWVHSNFMERVDTMDRLANHFSNPASDQSTVAAADPGIIKGGNPALKEAIRLFANPVKQSKHGEQWALGSLAHSDDSDPYADEEDPYNLPGPTELSNRTPSFVRKLAEHNKAVLGGEKKSTFKE
jgi:hypothetical protein